MTPLPSLVAGYSFVNSVRSPLLQNKHSCATARLNHSRKSFSLLPDGIVEDESSEDFQHNEAGEERARHPATTTSDERLIKS